MVIRYLENMACVWKKGNSYNFIGGKSGGNRSLGIFRLGCHIYTEMYFLQEVG